MSDELHGDLNGEAENDRTPDPFVRFPRDTARDASLSWKARGILAWMLSHAANWTIRQEDMIAAATDGLASLRAGLDELIIAGYIERRKVQRTNGGWRYKYVIRDRRTEAMCGKSAPAKTMCGKSAPACVENPHSKKNKETEEKETSSSSRTHESPEAINTESKEIEPPKSPVVQDKRNSNLPRRSADAEWLQSCPPGCPDVRTKNIPADDRMDYDVFVKTLLEHVHRAARVPTDYLWIIDHYRPDEIRGALLKTSRADRPCWAYFCKVLAGLDETPKQKSRRKDGPGIKPPPERRFDQETLQWVEVTS